MKHNLRASVTVHLHNLSLYSLHNMIEVSAKAWHSFLYLVTHWQYQLRLGKLFCISSRLGSISQAWHAFPYLITHWILISGH